VLLDEMISYIDVFGPGVRDRIVCKGNAALSAKMIIAAVGGKSSSVRRVHNYTVSLVTFTDAIYFAFTNKVTTVCCFLEDYEVELPATSKINPEVEQ